MLKQILQKHIDQPVKVTAYNSKYRKTRGIEMRREYVLGWGARGFIPHNIWCPLGIPPNNEHRNDACQKNILFARIFKKRSLYVTI